MVAAREKVLHSMVNKTFIPEGEAAPASQIGATLEALAATIAARRDADEASYTYRLLTGNVDGVLKKVMEESGEVALAAKDVEGWATSSLAAAVALEATEAGGTTTGAETADGRRRLPPFRPAAPGVRRGGRSFALRGRRCGVSSSRRAGALRHHARRVCCRAEQSHDRRRAAARRRSLARRVRTTRKVAFSCRSCAGKRRESRGSLSERNDMKNFGGAPELKERRISWPDCLELMACAVSQMWS